MKKIKKKLLLSGGYGFLGNMIFKKLKSEFDVFRFRSSEFDLRDSIQTKNLFNQINPNYVVHAAARLGGIGDNQKNPAHYFYDNILMGVNVLNFSQKFNVEKTINIGTVCSYPLNTPKPFKEEFLWSGLPEPTNASYGLAKKSVIDYSFSLHKQYKFNCVNLLLTNLYGTNDDFREETSHVIPAQIRKINYAIENNIDEIVVWGDGSPTRDFLNIKDAANSVLLSLQSNYNDPMPINIASGHEISIKELVNILVKLMYFKGKVKYDLSKPNGQPYRLLDISRAKKILDYKPTVKLEEGLEDTINYFLRNKNIIKNLKKKYDD